MKKDKERIKRDMPAGVRKAGKVVGIAAVVLMLLVAAANTTLAVQKYTRPGETPSIFGVSPMFVLSGSMEPTLKLDDLILIRRVNADKLDQGDIITFKPEDSLYAVTHRIVLITCDESGNRFFTTKGDNNDEKDKDLVAESQILGVFLLRIPKVGRLVEWFIIQPQGMAICVAAPLILFVVIDLFRRLGAHRKQEKNRKKTREKLEYLRGLAANWSQEEDVSQQPVQSSDSLPEEEED